MTMADDNRPVLCAWDGEAFYPAGRYWAKLADRQFVVGERYPIQVWEERSVISHNHYFACVAEAWKNLPEDMAMLYPTPPHLRKRALIQAGYYDETIVDAGSKAAALRVASFVRPSDDFALVFVRDQFVIRRTAKSQSRKAMGKKDFQESKQAVLDIVSEMVGVTTTDLQGNAGQAA